MSNIKNVLIIINAAKQNAESFASAIEKLLKAKKINAETINTDSKEKENLRKKKFDLIVSLGGDGTMLRAIRDFYTLNVPFFGINNGHLGFITPFSKDNWEKGLREIAEGDYSLSERVLLDVSKKRNGKTVISDTAVNELYLHRPDGCSVIKVRVSANGEVFASPLSADGVIVATPTGSTAYSMATGASVLANDMKAFVFKPNNPFLASDRGLVFSKETELKICLDDVQKTEEALIDIDGRAAGKFTSGDELVIKLAEMTAKIVRNKEMSMFGRIGEKLQWVVKR